jgi:hypothetical protein
MEEEEKEKEGHREGEGRRETEEGMEEGQTSFVVTLALKITVRSW